MDIAFHKYIDGLKLYGHGLSIIYAEDDLVVQEQVKSFLEKFFDDVRVSSNGEDALLQYNARYCDILVTDVAMPKLDGIELCNAVLQINPDQKIVVVSAHNESYYLMKLIDLGVDKFLLKPFDNKKFLKSMYSISLELFEKSERARLQNELCETYEATQLLIDTIDDILIILENDIVMRANLAFLQMSGFKDIEEFNKSGGRIDSLFIHAKGYVSHQNNSELLEGIQNNPTQKALIKDSGGARVMLIRQKQLGKALNVVILTDVTGMERDLLGYIQKLLTNPFTGIANKHAIISKLSENITRSSLYVMLISIVKHGRIVKWYGKDIGIQAEKLLCNTISALLKQNEATKNIFFANYDKNEFLIISDSKSLIYSISTEIEILKLMYQWQVGDEDKIHTIHIEAKTKTIFCEQNKYINDIASEIENKFDMMIDDYI
jgi:CheY-like chemotaxis protein